VKKFAAAGTAAGGWWRWKMKTVKRISSVGADSLLLEEVGLDGVASQYRYDACGRTVARTFAAGHPQAITHAFAWSASGQLVPAPRRKD
jgi:YD repeat-containing protein